MGMLFKHHAARIVNMKMRYKPLVLERYRIVSPLFLDKFTRVAIISLGLPRLRLIIREDGGDVVQTHEFGQFF